MSHILAGLAALIMLQSLWFKFSGAEESVEIFTALGMEPYGRIGVGIAEFISSLLLIVPKTRLYGGILGLGIMGGAIFSHLTELGIVVQDDGGLLFGMAIVTAVCCLGVALIEWRKRK